eukprot:GFUD01004426.1.p1 GENE.GFUD01004426.1~~GFUD01004426.1.p1  ORF type:complete len:519 (+),score=155.88 GFUD01004426.1:230-1786(+)
MILSSVFSVVFFSLTCLADDIAEEEGVLVLTDSNFDQAITENQFVLVDFYAPWCGHCQQLEPEYVKAAKELLESKSEVKLAKVDATAHKETGTKFNIEGFPTLKFFKDGKPADYNGPREAKGIVSWLEKKTGPSCTEITKEGEIKEILEKEQAMAVGFFKDLEGEKAKVFKDVASGYDDVKFFLVSKPELMKEYHQKDGSILVMKTFDEKEAHFADTLSKENLEKFIRRSTTPLVTEFSQENAGKIFSSDIVKHFLLLSSKLDDEHESRMEDLRIVAKENREKMIFVHLNVADEEHENVLDFFGIKVEQCPTFVIFEMESSAKFLPTGDAAKDISISNMGGFVKNYFDGKIQKSIKSAELPADWDAKPVKVLVTTNFEEVALDKTKDAFVEFYAPWCGHCKSLAPIWDQIAEKYQDRKDLVIAKIDATENEVDGAEVEGFPTLKMYKKESNEAVDYVGKRDFESIVKFIETGEQEEAEEEDEPEDDEDENFDEDEEDEIEEEGDMDEEEEDINQRIEL